MIRRILPVLAAVALTTTACGSDGNDASASSEPGGQMRTIEHAMGTTEVPAEPERVVVLDTPQLDAAAALDVTPVGASRTAVATELPGWIGDLGDIAEVGTIQEPNLEAIAALQPDLILSSTVRHEAIYEQLSAIAPTVFAETIAEEWKDNFLLFADALGRRDRAAQLIADYERRATAIGEDLAVDGDDPTVGIVRFLPDEIRIYGPESFSGSVLLDLGVALPAAVADVTGDIAIYPSAEQVGQVADADVLFVTTYGDPAETTSPAVQGGPIWPTIPAVAGGRAHEVSDDTWMLGIGVLGANAILDDIEATLS